jgi:hypothetical protein
VKICSGNQTLTAAGNILVPTDSRINPLNLAGSITDANASTYALKYSTADVYAAGYTVAGDATLTAFPGTPPVTGSHGFQLTGINATAMILNVSATSGTGVTLNAVFQSDSTQGA